MNGGENEVRVTTVGLDRRLDEILRDCPGIRVESEDTGRPLRELPDTLVIGPRLTSPEACNLLSQSASGNARATRNIVLYRGEREVFQSLVDEDRLYYLADCAISDQQLGAIVRAAGASTSRRSRNANARLDENERQINFCISLPMQQDLPSAARLLAEIAREEALADRVYWLIYDSGQDILWSKESGIVDRSESAAAGLIGFVLRTGASICCDRAAAHPLYDAEADNPGGRGDDRLMVVPVPGHNGPVGLIVVIREPHREAFAQHNQDTVEQLASYAAPTFEQIILQNNVQAVLLREPKGTSGSDIFREEAWENHQQSGSQAGDVLKSLPPWLRSAQWILLAMALITVALVIWGRTVRIGSESVTHSLFSNLKQPR